MNNEKYYEPGEDTYLFFDTLKEEYNFIKKTNPKILVEIGCGSGILSNLLKTLLPDSFLLATDINPFALEKSICLSKNNKNTIQFIKSNLLNNIDPNKIEMLIFNPPYVQTSDTFDNENYSPDINEDYLRYSYSGGFKGREIINKFLDSCNDVKLIYILVIKINEPNEIVTILRKMGYTVEIVNSKRIMGETLYVIRAIK